MGDLKEYSNKYGKLVLQTITPYKLVSEIWATDISSKYKFSIKEGQKIALITENIGIRVYLGSPISCDGCYVMIHKSASFAAVAKVVSLEFYNSINLTEEMVKRKQLKRNPDYYNRKVFKNDIIETLNSLKARIETENKRGGSKLNISLNTYENDYRFYVSWVAIRFLRRNSDLLITIREDSDFRDAFFAKIEW